MLPIPFNNMIGVISSSEVKTKRIFPPANTYGLLYNYPAAADNLLPMNSNFRLPNDWDIFNLQGVLGGQSQAHKLKSTRYAPVVNDIPRWNDPSPHTPATPTNELNFNALPAGLSSEGNYPNEGYGFYMWTDMYSGSQGVRVYMQMHHWLNTFADQQGLTSNFASVRLVRDVDTSKNEDTLPDGTILENHLVDIDGNSYELVKIGDLVWTVQNLKVTRLRNGTPIPKRESGTGSLYDPEYAVIYNDDSYT